MIEFAMVEKETKNYSNFVILQMGDSGGDGHEKTRNYYYKSNKDIDAWSKARDKGIKLFGWTLENLEDKSISRKQNQKLLELGHDFDYFKGNKEDHQINIYSDDLVAINLFLISLGDPEIKYEVVFPRPIEIGGYWFA